MKTLYKDFLTKSIWVAIFLFILRCLISWQQILNNISIYDIYGFAGEAISFTILIMTLYERKLWRHLPCKPIPVLNTTYAGILKSSYDNQERNATLQIKQTLLSIHITLKTAESKSHSITSSITNILGEKQLIWCYLNTPKAEFRYRSEVHYGAATLCIDDPNHLTGQYYTDRKTTGDLIFHASD